MPVVLSRVIPDIFPPSIMPDIVNPSSVMPDPFNPPSVIPDIFNRESMGFPKLGPQIKGQKRKTLDSR